jgi:signal transduction histidine kinase
MIGKNQSLRHKITFGYYAILTAIVALSVFALFELRYMERKIMFGEAISEFFDATLEIRRFEKNYFLYGKKSDYEENREYLQKAIKLLEINKKGFQAVSSASQINFLRGSLDKYGALMRQYATEHETVKDETHAAAIESMIRQTGKEIITTAEEISKAERRYLQTALYNTRDMLIFSIIFLCLLGAAIGQVLSRMVVKPLKLIENSMATIAEGRFESIHINSRDREIVSLAGALNKMLKELELRQRHLIQSEKLASLGTLLSGVAHELNNPLSNISTSAEILKEELKEADLQYKLELLAQVEEQCDRARNIVRSLLEFSRDSEFKKEKVALKNMINETLKFIKGHVQAEVSINTDIADDIFVYVDKQRIQQALLNLIKNAVESLEGHGEVSIKAQKHRAIDKVGEEAAIYNYLKYRGKCTLEEDTVDIEISDNGSGIPQDAVSKIFDPFFTTKDVGKGSGLGLYIVHEIIEEHDGCIAVDSKIGEGTTFLIRLPIKEKA